MVSATSSSEYSSWSEYRSKSGDLDSSRLSVLKCFLDDRNSHSGSLKEYFISIWLEYGVLVFPGYGVLDLVSFVVFSEVQAQIRRIFLDGYGVLVVRTVIFKYLRLSSRMHMDPNRGAEEQDNVDCEQNHALIATLIKNLQYGAEKCNTVNHEAKQVNVLLTVELEKYKERSVEDLEKLVQRKTELTRLTFEYGFDNQVKNIFSQEVKPIVDHLHLCTTHFEKELTKEVEEMIKIFESMEREVHETSRKNKNFDNDIDRLLESLPKNEKEQYLKQIDFLESKLASQDLLSLKKEYNELRTSYNALNAKFDSPNQTKGKSLVLNFSKPKVSVLEKVYTGGSSKPFSNKNPDEVVVVVAVVALPESCCRLHYSLARSRHLTPLSRRKSCWRCCSHDENLVTAVAGALEFLEYHVVHYRICAKLGREEVKPVSKKITMLDHSKVEPMGILKDVLCQHYSDNFIKKGDGDGKWHAKVRIIDPYGNVYDQGYQTKATDRKLSKFYKLSDIMSPDWF
ncbi:hypothetical protein Tco_0392413 [Tanacetum coccineum]